MSEPKDLKDLLRIWAPIAGNFGDALNAAANELEAQATLITELVGALEAFLPAYQAFVDSMNGFRASGETSSDSFASEQERKSTAQEEAFLALSEITFDQLNAVNNALTKAKDQTNDR